MALMQDIAYVLSEEVPWHIQWHYTTEMLYCYGPEPAKRLHGERQGQGWVHPAFVKWVERNAHRWLKGSPDKAWIDQAWKGHKPRPKDGPNATIEDFAATQHKYRSDSL